MSMFNTEYDFNKEFSLDDFANEFSDDDDNYWGDFFQTSYTTGAIPAAIATSLAIEGLCGFGEYPSEDPYIRVIDELWVNVRTIFRNCYGAVDTNNVHYITIDKWASLILHDAQQIIDAVELFSDGKVKVKYYVCSFQSLPIVFPHALWREDRTPKQKMMGILENEVLQYLRKGIEKDQRLEFTMAEYNVKITDIGNDVAMLTSFPVDLLWYDKFTRLALLESHTGKIKMRGEWHTKLTSGKNLTRIPFNSLSLQLFGDNSNIFSSMPLKIKNRLIEIAEKDKWTPLTTIDRVRASINKIYDPREKVFFRNLIM